MYEESAKMAYGIQKHGAPVLGNLNETVPMAQRAESEANSILRDIESELQRFYHVTVNLEDSVDRIGGSRPKEAITANPSAPQSPSHISRLRAIASGINLQINRLQDATERLGGFI